MGSRHQDNPVFIRMKTLAAIIWYPLMLQWTKLIQKWIFSHYFPLQPRTRHENFFFNVFINIVIAQRSFTVITVWGQKSKPFGLLHVYNTALIRLTYMLRIKQAYIKAIYMYIQSFCQCIQVHFKTICIFTRSWAIRFLLADRICI